MDLNSQFLFKTDFAKNSRFIIDFHTRIEKIDRWILISDLYKKWLESKTNINNTKQKIPKIIHHIWIGSPIPKGYKKFIDSWKAKNKSWEFILWDDKKLDNFNMVNRNLYSKLKNYGAKSDVARLEILYQIGGFYLDTDFECLKKIDESLLFNDFIACTGFNSFPELLNSFIASKPKTKFIEMCLEDLKKIKNFNLISNEIIEETGPFFLTRSFFKFKEKTNFLKEDMLILPSNYFFPLPNFLAKIPLIEAYDYKTELSIGLHHWETSWNKISFIENLRLLLKKLK